MNDLPNALFIIDTRKEQIAVAEAKRLGIPVVAVVDTNCDPDEVEFPIPGNDDAIRAATLMCKVISEAVLEGKAHRPSQVFEPDEPDLELEPSTDTTEESAEATRAPAEEEESA